MLHIATVHYQSPRWIEIQAAYLREHISVAYRTWTSLELIDPAYGAHFDRVIEQKGRHPGKLNHLAIEIAHEAKDDDLLMFLHGDAFPIADPMPMIAQGLARAPLIAVRRAENVDSPQPHPCFCVTTVGAWRSLPGDWSGGPLWPGAKGKLVTDVGGNLLRQLQLTNTPWVQLLRTNKRNIDPLHFAVYGDLVYHHGAGMRAGELGCTQSDEPPRRHAPARVPLLGPAVRRINRTGAGWWQRRVQAHNLRQSQLLYQRIQSGDSAWLAELI